MTLQTPPAAPDPKKPLPSSYLSPNNPQRPFTCAVPLTYAIANTTRECPLPSTYGNPHNPLLPPSTDPVVDIPVLIASKSKTILGFGGSTNGTAFALLLPPYPTTPLHASLLPFRAPPFPIPTPCAALLDVINLCSSHRAPSTTQ
ncbi:hypothetical protein CSAL01_00063 [Colletotrichum salicis]|uniref:Uncharacterized protein n=1 Tax=Colletotrichum salicis TaxID=1209931 RepID=A0A135V883_9PEZI|nr:hypothetical protein CSAL01_00063 [Colletotrichum salicis]